MLKNYSRSTFSAKKNDIKRYCEENGLDRSDSQISRMALKIHKRGDAVQDFEHGLRILGIITDTTARDAIRNIEREQVVA